MLKHLLIPDEKKCLVTILISRILLRSMEKPIFLYIVVISYPTYTVKKFKPGYDELV